jgi:sugar phosphate isomerase/epimerase
MRPTISQVTTLKASFETDVEEYAAAACVNLEIWLGKLETYLETHSVDDAHALLAEHRVSAPVASFQGGLLTSQGEARRLHWEHFGRRLELCQALSIGVIVIVGDLFGPVSAQDLERAQFSLVEAAKQAGQRGLRVALEFQASATFGNNLQTAAALVAEAGSPHLGLCLDAFHYFMGPSKEEDLGYLTRENLFHVQLCDVSGIARELATDGDRILPGDGDLNLQPILDRLRQIDYDGAVSVELMNPQIWEIPPRNVAEVGITALRKLLGVAER